jgi:NAD(P)-dependent dehydrogenase (short-subunit alcohol dehydrogenase family)
MTQRVLVTGGAVRLGSEICASFAAAGWHVVCHYNRSADAANALSVRLSALGGRCSTVAADLEDPQQRSAMMASVARDHGPLHCVVNNASSFDADQGLDFTTENLDRQLRTNLIAPLDLARLLALQATADGATIHNRSAIHVLDQKVFNLNPDYFSYTVSKLALERAVALQAQSLAPRVRVCGVAPGLMYLSGPQSQANFDRAAAANLLRRPTDPAQVAQGILFLAQTPAITGVTLAIDNGQHLVPTPRDIMFVVDELLQPP